MSEKSSSNGITFPGLLFLLFLTLKLTGNIDWSWWWVTAPLWAPLALVLLVGPVILLRTRRKPW